MAESVRPDLSPDMISLLEKERLVLLGTIDNETKGPSVNSISWVHAVSAKKIRFALDGRSRLLQNIVSEPQVTLTFFAHERIYTLSGKAALLAQEAEGVPIRLAIFEVEIDAVRDVLFYGAKITQEPTYEKTYNPEAAHKLDSQVFSALKKA
ncbi:pyridoxamine 5'-phosphate oxidase family protein [Thermicanus aegyptius]|uniref:pyridoxamine 5'-phosphate oxidase family protein n=1 Tax=Thermicanus aegyptius TaxID=94009 RepID=UPI0003F80148|nr:pyridoxamine 5'-phosphate oxidase family protein [Thermicanus aegyptius]